MNELDFYVFLMKINCKNWGCSNKIMKLILITKLIRRCIPLDVLWVYVCILVGQAMYGVGMCVPSLPMPRGFCCLVLFKQIVMWCTTGISRCVFSHASPRYVHPMCMVVLHLVHKVWYPGSCGLIKSIIIHNSIVIIFKLGRHWSSHVSYCV